MAEQTDLFLDIIRKQFGENYQLSDQLTYIIYDNRELRSGVPTLLANIEGVVTIETTLDAGDYLVSSRCGIERKADDYVSSLFAGAEKTNLFDELSRLSESVKNPILILENENYLYSGRYTEESIEKIKASMLAVQTKMGIPMMKSNNKGGTAMLISEIAKYQQRKRADHDGIARRMPKNLSLDDRQIYFIEGLFNCGRKKAKQLLEVLGYPYNIFDYILHSELEYTAGGKLKGYSSGLAMFEYTLKNFGPKFIQQNKELLFNEFRRKNNGQIGKDVTD